MRAQVAALGEALVAVVARKRPLACSRAHGVWAALDVGAMRGCSPLWTRLWAARLQASAKRCGQSSQPKGLPSAGTGVKSVMAVRHSSTRACPRASVRRAAVLGKVARVAEGLLALVAQERLGTCWSGGFACCENAARGGGGDAPAWKDACAASVSLPVKCFSHSGHANAVSAHVAREQRAWIQKWIQKVEHVTHHAAMPGRRCRSPCRQPSVHACCCATWTARPGRPAGLSAHP